MSAIPFHPGSRLHKGEESRTFVRVEGNHVIYHTMVERHRVTINEWQDWCRDAHVLYLGSLPDPPTKGQRMMGMLSFDNLANEMDHDLGRVWWVCTDLSNKPSYRITIDLNSGRQVEVLWPFPPYTKDLCAMIAAAAACEADVQTGCQSVIVGSDD